VVTRQTPESLLQHNSTETGFLLNKEEVTACPARAQKLLTKTSQNTVPQEQNRVWEPTFSSIRPNLVVDLLLEE
jgi:hypothetical protein